MRARTATCPRTRSITPPRNSSRSTRARIAELEDKLARAEVIDVSKLSGDTIKFGATVTLVDEDTDKKQVWQIVGEPEADAKKGRISITSPLARALINKKKGTSVEVVTPGGAKAYEITKIEWKYRTAALQHGLHRPADVCWTQIASSPGLIPAIHCDVP